VKRSAFGVLADGTPVDLYRFTNRTGMEIAVTNYGATLVSCRTRDRFGRLADIVLGFGAVDGYVESSAYFGATIGRYANRIANARFVLDGRSYVVAANDPPHHLHGGRRGFDKVAWTADVIDDACVAFRLTSPDGDEAYPGRLDVRVSYALGDDNDVTIDYEATTDKPTPVNLTHHSYFNLRGEGVGDVLDHDLVVNAQAYTPVDEGLIPTGDVAPVAGTPLDFRTRTRIGSRIDTAHAQLRYAGGYDHNYVLDGASGQLRTAAVVTEPETGRTLAVATTEPGLQLYTGNFLDGTTASKSGGRYMHRGGLCLEPQHFPDSPNQRQFPDAILRPGKTFASRTVLRFGHARA
jgi:aldose 1-epimerase